MRRLPARLSLLLCLWSSLSVLSPSRSRSRTGKSETTGGNPPRLLADELVVFATAAGPHAGQPGVHRPAEPDFWISGSNCLRLEIQEDQSGYRTVGDANPSPFPVLPDSTSSVVRWPCRLHSDKGPVNGEGHIPGGTEGFGEGAEP